MSESADLLAAWDEVDSAINRIVTAQPHQMTAAAERLERAQKAMRTVIYAPSTMRRLIVEAPATLTPKD